MPRSVRAGSARLAVDIGGTFTDVVLEGARRRATGKVLTTHDAPERGVMAAIELALAEAGIGAGDVTLVIHGTTLATNAIIERKGARTALLTTEGFRDSIEIGYEHRFEQYDIYVQKPAPLVPRFLRLGVPERMAASGEVLKPLDEQAVLAAIPTFRKHRIESVAVGFLHAYANPAHEQRARDILKAELPDLSLTLSSDVCPEVREYDRISTTVANAYIQPLMASYLGRLDQDLRRMGFTCPLFLMMSGGGLTALETAIRNPVRLVESGPAGGAILASYIAAECGLSDVLSFDMGGTTAKICLIDDFTPQQSRSFEVGRQYRFAKGSGFPLLVPVIEMVEIGAGGGSIASVDELKRIQVGPRSAGSQPGPACYGLGGEEPTVTDADLAMGRIDPDAFAGGRLRLDPGKAATALRAGVGKGMRMSDVEAAFGVAEIVDENMANAARVHAIERGKVLSRRTLIAFGGAAPLHAARLAEKVDIERIIVPTDAGVGSALGFLRAPVAYEVVRSRFTRLDSFDPDAVNALYDEMKAEAYAVVRAGAPTGRLVETRTAMMRYVGQGHEVAAAIPARPFRAGDTAVLKRAFETAYQALYNRTIPSGRVEILSWTLALSTVPPRPKRVRALRTTYRPKPEGRRPVLDGATGRFREVPVYRRAALDPGARIAGPAMIAEDATSTYVSPDFDAEINPLGYIVMERKRRAGAAAAAAKGGGAKSRAIEQVRLQITWDRLLAVVEEQGRVLVRTGFSTSTREAGDISAGIFEPRQGKMMAQAVTGTPGHINSMAEAVKHFLRHIGQANMKPGDTFITNDAWMGTGHLHDFTVVTPIFRKRRMVALFACTTHVIDVGGLGLSPDGREIYHEGVQLPILKLIDRGKVNEWILDIVRLNVRTPVETAGDIYSLAGCNEVGGRHLLAMMDEFGLDDLDALADYIFATSRKAKLEAVRKLRPGTYRNTLTMDGYDKPIHIACAVTVHKEGITVDFTGTDPESPYGINVPYCYADAYTSFGVNCIIAPRIPNNAGSLEVVKVVAPEGCIVNARRPRAVASRGTIGQVLPDVAFGCLHQAVEGGVPAESTSSLYSMVLFGAFGRTDPKYPYPANYTPFDVMTFHCGGSGARPTSDGLNVVAFPSGIRNVPVEVTETITPLVVWKKELRPESGGAGRWRGGTGQTMVIGNREGAPFAISARFDRCFYPPRGREGGLNGGNGIIALGSGTRLHPKGIQTIPPGDTLVVEMPGGAGYGDAKAREAWRVAADVRNGLVGVEAARRDYGVVVDEEGVVDEAATAALRGGATAAAAE
ncbi:MAG: hydantoinase B/oxoprolinase family protein [Proteobacteria bacterium]|nr:hydantoinase B/oxoprolinase family protein [Pseudomonadota bacterium]